MPTMTHNQTKAIAPWKRTRSAVSATRARSAVIRSPYPIIVRNSMGTPEPTAPGARMVPPAMRKGVHPQQWYQRQLPWQKGQPGHDIPECDQQIGHQAQRELNPEEHNRLHRQLSLM